MTLISIPNVFTSGQADTQRVAHPEHLQAGQQGGLQGELERGDEADQVNLGLRLRDRGRGEPGSQLQVNSRHLYSDILIYSSCVIFIQETESS